MHLLPSCAYYLRRLVKKATHAQLNGICDLLPSLAAQPYHIDQRLHHLYADLRSREAVILHLESLTCSHQHAHSQANQAALENITQHILWYCGYDVGGSPDLRVLVVDDTLEILKLVQTILAQQGYQVSSALNGQLGLAMIQAQLPDVVLLDLSLPDITGYDVYQQLQASPHTQHIPVVFMSGQDQIDPPKHRSGASVSYLAKPFKPQVLLEHVQQALGHPVARCVGQRPAVEQAVQERQTYAHKLRSRIQLAPYFFRATLNGRYLRVSESFAHLWGYPASADLIAQVTNLWEQLYHNTKHQHQWHQCSHSPNQMHTQTLSVPTPDHQILNIEEHVCIVQDDYQNRLFFQGYLMPLN